MGRLVVLLGPTGVGKTELSYAIAEHLQSPVISADSRQLYRDMRIGTAAPTDEQLRRCKHYFIGTLGIDDYYSAAMYEADVLSLTASLFPIHPDLLLTGGSMMYIDAVCNGIDDIPTVDAETRATLLERYHNEGLEPLVQELRLLDPDYYAIVDQKNPKRVLHALEICYMTGRTYTSFRTGNGRTLASLHPLHPRPFSIVKIGLTRPREELYARINARVDQMMADGLLDEARRLFSEVNKSTSPQGNKQGVPNALNTVGYKELFAYFRDEWTLDFAVEKIKQNTRIYSRKQMTWFRRDPSIHWFHPDAKDDILAFLDEGQPRES